MRFAALAVLFLVAACQTAPPEMSDAEMAQIEAEVTQAIADQWAGFKEAILNQDVEGWLSFWTPEVRVLEPGMDLTGNDLFDAGREFFGSGGQVFAFDMESFEVFVHGDTAYQIGQYDESYQYGDGTPAEAHYHVFTRWEKQTDGIWRVSRWVSGPREAPTEG